MKIGAVNKFSLIDYPGKISAIIFTQGCNFRCPFCHNPELVLPESFNPCVPEEEIFSFLKSRRGMLDALVISGGEPTLHPDLKGLINKIRELGYAVKLDTNGSRPDIVRNLVYEKAVDYIAMDIKAPFSKYEKVAGMDVAIDKIAETVKIVRDAGIDHEFRTTIAKPLLELSDLVEVARTVGSGRHILQMFVPTKTLDESLLGQPQYSEKEYAVILAELKKINAEVTLR